MTQLHVNNESKFITILGDRLYIPDDQLENVETLIVEDIEFDVFSDNVYTSKTIKALDVEKWGFSTKNLDKLVNLESVSIHKSSSEYLTFSSFPKEILTLKNLKKINLKGYDLNEFPEELCDMTSLTHLNLNYNRIKRIPESIGKLINLESFDIGGNRFTTIPREINNLKKLNNLSIFRYGDQRGNIQGDIDIGGLSNLETLNLSLKSIELFTPSFHDLRKLDRIWIFDILPIRAADTINNYISMLNYNYTVTYHDGIISSIKLKNSDTQVNVYYLTCY